MARSKKLVKSSSYYITSVAITDLVIGILAMSFVVIRAFKYRNWDMEINQTVCCFLTTSMLVLLSSLILQLVTVSIDRYWAICYAVSYRNKNSNWDKVGVASCWLFGILVGLLLVYFNHDAECHLHSISGQSCLNYFNMLSFVIIGATIAIIFFYGCIYRSLKKQVTLKIIKITFSNNSVKMFQTTRCQLALSTDPLTNQKEVKVAKTMLLVIGSFILCWIPFAICVVIKTVGNDSNSSFAKVVETFCLCATHWNASIDPVIYAYRIKDIREAIKNTLRCATKKEDKNQMRSDSSMIS